MSLVGNDTIGPSCSYGREAAAPYWHEGILTLTHTLAPAPTSKSSQPNASHESRNPLQGPANDPNRLHASSNVMWSGSCLEVAPKLWNADITSSLLPSRALNPGFMVPP